MEATRVTFWKAYTFQTPHTLILKHAFRQNAYFYVTFLHTLSVFYFNTFCLQGVSNRAGVGVGAFQSVTPVLANGDTRVIVELYTTVSPNVTKTYFLYVRINRVDKKYIVLVKPTRMTPHSVQ